MKHSPNTTYAAVVLAADRSPDDPLIRRMGVSSKALIEIAGTPMILRVLEALEQSGEIGTRLLSGPSWHSVQQVARLHSMIQAGEINWIEHQATPSTSAYTALQTIDPGSPVLLTTSDHPLLNATILDYFCRKARNSGLDIAIGLTTFERIRQKFPDVTKTVLRFKDGSYCGCNLFAFLTPQARQVANYWRQVEKHRKKPFRAISVLGWSAVLRYLLRQLSLKDGVHRLSKRFQLRIDAIQLPFAEAALDVDTLSDHSLVQELIEARESDLWPV